MTEHTTPAHSPWRVVAILSVAVALLASLIGLAFTWTTVEAEAEDIPVGIVATDDQYTTVQDLDTGEAITLHRVPDAAEAESRVAERDLYGAIILTPEPEILTASAASTPVSNELQALAPVIEDMLPSEAAATVAVTDIAPWSEDDPNGAGFAVAGLPIILTGFLGGVAISLLITGRLRRLVTAVSYSAIAGIALTTVLQGLLGILQGNALANAVIIGLAAASGTMLIAGLHSLLGRPGIPAGVLFLLLLANPLAGFNIPTDFYPGAWGEVGQWLAPGAAATLLRAESYFPDQPTLHSWIILLIWTGAGILLLLSRHRAALHDAEPAHIGAPEK